MKKKLIFLGLTLLIIGITIFAIKKPQKKEESKEYLEPVSIELPEEVADDNIKPTGLLDSDYENVVIIAITQKDILEQERDEWFDDYALTSLSEYFSRYVNYYVELEPGIYEAEYLSGSYESHSYFPQFTLELKLDETIFVDCIYNPSTKRFVFKSSLNPERK